MEGTEEQRYTSISLIVPAYNESAGIAEMIIAADERLSSLGVEYEIIVVDDGSSDGTCEIAEATREGRPLVRVLRHSANRGYGAAIRTGFEAATKSLVAFTDADRQFDVGELRRFLVLAEDHEIVCGYRIDRKDSWLRKQYSLVYNLLVRLLLGTTLRDIDCAFKVFRRDDRERILPTERGFLVNADMMLRAREHGLAVVEVGVTHFPRQLGTSTVSVTHIVPVLVGLLRLWWNRVAFPANRVATPPSCEAMWKYCIVGTVTIAALLLFVNLNYPLIDRDETRYAEIPREMLATSDWMMPQLNFEPYYDKPPLLYWLCAGSFKLFGISEWSARLVPATCALSLLVATISFAWRLLGIRVAAFSGIALLVTPAFVFSGRYLLIDGLLSLLVALASYAGFLSIAYGRFRYRWWIASAVCTGLGVLAKGPVAGVLFGPPLLAYSFLSASSAKVTVRSWVWYLSIVLAIASPWFLVASLSDSNFLYEFFYRHHVARFGGAYHAQPVWYFVPVALIAGSPWTFMLFPYLTYLGSRRPDVACLRSTDQGFLLLWAAWCFMFFTISKCKLATYLLPALPAYAILVGQFLEYVILSSKAESLAMARWVSPKLATGTLLLVSAALVGVSSTMGWLDMRQVVCWGGIWCLAAFAAAWVGSHTPGVAVNWSVAGALSLLLVIQGNHSVIPELGRTDAIVMPGPEIASWIPSEEVAVATFAHEWSGVPFYTRRNDVQNFSGREPQALVDYVSQYSSSIVILKGRHENLEKQLHARGLQTRVLESGNNTVVMEVICQGNLRIASVKRD